MRLGVDLAKALTEGVGYDISFRNELPLRDKPASGLNTWRTRLCSARNSRGWRSIRRMGERIRLYDQRRTAAIPRMRIRPQHTNWHLSQIGLGTLHRPEHLL